MERARPEVDPQARIDELEAEVARLRALVDEEPPDIYLPGQTHADVQEAIEAKGAEVGTLTGPPIIGTTDTVNAGPATLKPGEELPPQAVYDANGRIEPA